LKGKDVAGEQFIWAEKYRPDNIEETILPDNLKKVFYNLIKQGEVTNLLFSGSAGTGKTTAAKALCKELDCDYIVVNGSDEGRSIDILRDKIKKFVSTTSMKDKPKVVIIDEADYLGPAVQPALRNFIEEFSKNSRFILTCNYKHKIIPPLHSRCSVVDFTVGKEEKAQIMASIAKRMISILQFEKIDFNQTAVLEIVKRFYPDTRRTINELQRYSQVNGKIDSGIIALVDTSKVKSLIGFMKKGDFKSCRQWIADNPETDQLFDDLYTNINEYVEPASLPNLILIMGEYQHKAAFVTNQEINLAAFVVEVMKSVKWK
jgi:replication-associated recombination protein RarA